MVDLSILITSNKPYESFAKNVVDHICSCSTDSKYEIVICHTDEINDDRVIAIKDNIHTGGNGYAISHAFNNCNGKYFQYLTDDNIVHGNIFKVLDIFESSEFQKRDFQVLTLQAGSNNLYTTIERYPSYPNPLINTDSFCILPDFYAFPYPGMSRECVKKLGGHIFHPRLKYFGDWWLGAFLYLNEEPCIQCNDIKFFPMKNSNQNHTFDPITNQHASSSFGESYVNVYRLIKNYRRDCHIYVYDNENDYITTQTILKAMNETSNSFCYRKMVRC
jgi:hypothetical protein